MELQKTKHQIRLEQWRRIVYECRNSDLTVKSWCAENGINVGTYYRWQKKVWESETQSPAIIRPASESMTFAEYKPPAYGNNSGTAVILQIGSICLEIQNGASPETIEAVMHTITSYVK